MPLPSPAEALAIPPEEPPIESAVTGNIGEAVSQSPSQPSRSVRTEGGWAIQVGAFEHEDEARRRLAVARSKAAAALRAADPYTEKTTKGDKTLFRARFAGFDRARAEAACKILQRNELTCMALKN
jgi:D-alanyl-D-alanine carboxypeptidase